MDILLVEDDEIDARNVKRLLAQAANLPHTLTTSNSVGESLQRLSEKHFGIILLDLGLPDASGLETLHLIKPRCNGSAIIVLTGHDAEDFAVEAVSAGAQDFLQKESINTDILVRTIRYARERKQAETKLRRSELFLRSILDAMPANIAVVNPAGYIVSVNEAWKAFSRENGRDPSHDDSGEVSYFEVCDKAARLGEREAGKIKEAIQQMLSDGRTNYWAEYPCHAPDRQRWCEIWMTRFGTGNDRHVVISHEEVTERKTAVEKVREQADLLNMTKEAIISCDIEGRILFWNHGAEMLYRAPYKDMLGRNIRDFPGPEAAIEGALTQLQDQGEWASELNQQTLDGRAIVVDSRWTLAPARQNRAASVIIICSDITEKKSLEREFLRAQRLESLGTLAGGIAHDLNNVLSPIMTGLSLIEDESELQESRHIIEMMQQSVDRGARIVKQILSFARGSEEERVVIEPRYLTDRVVDMVRATFPPSIRVHNRLPKGLSSISADPTQLEQAFMNLLVNARDAMPGGGTITLAGEDVEICELDASRHYDAVPGHYVALSVEDSGTGIPPEVIDQIFDPFFTTKGVGKGTGLGLSTVIGIIKAHKGFITVDSKVGKGTRFTLHIPITQTEDPAVLRESKLIKEGSGEAILLVDDEEPGRQMVATILTRANYQVIQAAHGAEAIALLADRTRKIDLMIVDLMMPILDGPATIHAVRHLQAELPILIMSGSVERDIDRSNPVLNEIRYLHKPSPTAALLKAVRETLEERPVDSGGTTSPA